MVSTKRYSPLEQSFPAQIPEEEFKEIDPKVLDAKVNEQLLDFSALLDTLSTVEAKKKALWKQIYENAVTDRKNAYLLFGNLYMQVKDDADKHGLHGMVLAKYLERMEKANNQLIKLAELVEEVDADEAEVSDEDIYDKIHQVTQKNGN
jgi:hypothetical protein